MTRPLEQKLHRPPSTHARQGDELSGSIKGGIKESEVSDTHSPSVAASFLTSIVQWNDVVDVDVHFTTVKETEDLVQPRDTDSHHWQLILFEVWPFKNVREPSTCGREHHLHERQYTSCTVQVISRQLGFISPSRGGQLSIYSIHIHLSYPMNINFLPIRSHNGKV